MLTDERLAKIAARCDKATTGPWAAGTDWSHWAIGQIGAAGAWARRIVEMANQQNDRRNVGACDLYGVPDRNDAEFIAHARQDIPDLLNEVARLKLALADRTDRHDRDGKALMRAAAEREVMLAELKRLEWSASASGCCPRCDQFKPGSPALAGWPEEFSGHRPGCTLAAAIAAGLALAPATPPGPPPGRDAAAIARAALERAAERISRMLDPGLYSAAPTPDRVRLCDRLRAAKVIGPGLLWSPNRLATEQSITQDEILGILAAELAGPTHDTPGTPEKGSPRPC